MLLCYNATPCRFHIIIMNGFAKKIKTEQNFYNRRSLVEKRLTVVLL